MNGAEPAPTAVDGSVIDDAVRTGFRLIAVRVANALLAFLASLIVARALGPAGRGTFALPVAIVGIAFALSHLGIEHAHVYLASRGEPLPTLWANAARTGWVLGALAAAALVMIAATGGGALWPELPVGWVVVAAVQLPLLLQTLFWSGLLQLHGRLLGAASAPLIANALLTAAAAVLAAADLLTPFRAVALWVAANIVTWLVLLATGRATGLAGGRPHTATIRSAVAFGVKAYVGVTLFFLLLRTDQLLVERIVGTTALGLYSLSVVLAELLWLATDPFAVSVLRHQVRAGSRDDRILGDSAARVALLVGVPLALAAWVLAPVLIPLAYGADFAGAVSPFRLLLPGVVALALQRPFGPVLVKQGRMGLVMGFGVATFGGNVVLTIALLRLLGTNGAAVASSVCYTALAAAYLVVTRDGRGWRALIPTRTDVARTARAFQRGPRHVSLTARRSRTGSSRM